MQETPPAAASPYAPRRTSAETDIRVQPPREEAKKQPSQEEMAAFVNKVGDGSGTAAPGKVRTVDPTTGEIKEEDKDAEVKMTEATLAKVEAFLDVNMRGPITLMTARHKLFAMRIPTQQEILDVTAITGVRAGEDLNAAQAQWSIIGELRKATYGYVGLESAEAQLLRANLAWPKKWPPLREVNWTESRDPYVITEEIIPLWTQYLVWRSDVVPTKAEIDFYWASQR